MEKLSRFIKSKSSMGKVGLFVNMPTRKVGTQYEEICTILDENVKKEIRTALLEKYSQCNKSQQGEDDF